MSRKVSSSCCAIQLSGDANIQSKIRKVERFYSRHYLGIETALDFLLHFKTSKKCLLIMDRTNWKYGGTDINYIAVYGISGSQQSLMNVDILDNNGGSSNFEDRKSVIKPVVKQLGLGDIEALLCDREFFSIQFASYLIKEGIPFVIRVKENLNFIQPFLSKLKFTGKVFKRQKIGSFDGKDIYLDLSGKKLKKQYLLLVSFKVSNPLKLYRKRWEIECFFKKIKTAGFNLESTHIKDYTRLKSLILLCAMAHLICTILEIFRHCNVQPMKFKKTLNCYQFSFFRYGLDWITELILSTLDTLPLILTKALFPLRVG